jgi:hypothetical protein
MRGLDLSLRPEKAEVQGRDAEKFPSDSLTAQQGKRLSKPNALSDGASLPPYSES